MMNDYDYDDDDDDDDDFLKSVKISLIAFQFSKTSILFPCQTRCPFRVHSLHRIDVLLPGFQSYTP